MIGKLYKRFKKPRVSFIAGFLYSLKKAGEGENLEDNPLSRKFKNVPCGTI